MESREIFTLKEAAEYLRISDRTLIKLIHSKQVPAAKIGRAWRLQKKALDSFLANGGTKNE